MDLNDIFGPDKPIDLVTPEDVAVGEYIYGNVPVYRSIPVTQSYGIGPFSMTGQSSQAFDEDSMSLTSYSMVPANDFTCEIFNTANIKEQIGSSQVNTAALKEQIGSVQVNYESVPEQPSFLVSTHFEIRARIEEITSKINHYLLINPTISFEFSSSDYQVEISHFPQIPSFTLLYYLSTVGWYYCQRIFELQIHCQYLSRGKK